MNPYMNKFTSISALLTAVVLVAGTAFAAGPAEWVPPAGDDLRIASLPAAQPAAPPSRHVESQPVSYAWPLTIDRSETAPAGPAMESRQYWVDTTGDELERGIELPLSAPGAIVRVSALHADAGVLLDADRLQVSVDGQSLSTSRDGGGLELFTGRDLQTQGMSVPSDTLAFQLPDRGRADSLRLQLAGAPARQPLVVHIFEPQSPWVGKLSAARHNYLVGDELQLDVGLVNGEERIAANSVQAVLVSPDAAHSWPLEVSDDGLSLKGAAPKSLPTTGEGLYEVHAYLEDSQGGTTVRRDIKLAVNIAVPTARLSNRIDTGSKSGLSMGVGIKVATAGRYQLSGQVWGTAEDGSLQPLAMAQTAAVLEPGKRRLTLEVPADLLSESGLAAPFEVREVRLLDQGRMAVLESRRHGFTIEPEPREKRRSSGGTTGSAR